MRFTRTRLTVCRLMIVVAISGLVLLAESGRRRYPYCRSMAERCVLVEKTHLNMAAGHERIAVLYRKRAKDPRQSRRYNEESAYFYDRFAQLERTRARKAAQRGQSYRLAYLYPWLAIPLEVPEPPGVNITAQRESVEK